MRAKRLPRVGAFVVAVLEDQPSACQAAYVVYLLVERRRLTLVRDRVARHPQYPTTCRMRTTWMRPGSSWWISRILPTELFCP